MTQGNFRKDLVESKRFDYLLVEFYKKEFNVSEVNTVSVEEEKALGIDFLCGGGLTIEQKLDSRCLYDRATGNIALELYQKIYKTGQEIDGWFRKSKTKALTYVLRYTPDNLYKFTGLKSEKEGLLVLVFDMETLRNSFKRYDKAFPIVKTTRDSYKAAYNLLVPIKVAMKDCMNYELIEL